MLKSGSHFCGTPEEPKPNPLIISELKVRARGIEPPRGRPHMNLNHARLPIPPRTPLCEEITLIQKWQPIFRIENFSHERMVWHFSPLGIS